MKEEISHIVEELNRIGAKIPEPKLAECLNAHEFLLHGILEARTLAHALAFTPGEDIKNWDIARIDGQRQLVNALSGQGYIPAKDAEIMQGNLLEAVNAIKGSDWAIAIDRLQRYSFQIETSLPVWHEDCACVTKGDIVTAVHRGIDDNKDIVIADHCNIIWQDTIAALNRHGILTSEEGDNLIKAIRW